ncbi:CoA transferase [Alginatibacterium sediminis]|uniref:CoA transferase n=1 Tax=Alginatibacterium sediminis TaxID=2164068 RepID=A0A420EGI6_9ALTE|nr:CaiB/BaiF CoA-transferase family protein [Alginatibacterium sediminis]RKF19783.1 CoA transferase [Alginatibacterium sediminis]
MQAQDLPLAGILVLDFSQFLAGPSAALRLADLGARVIKIERSGVGDLCRQLTISNLTVGGESAVFQTINRNKESYSTNLKDPVDLEKVKSLIKEADIMIQNFRPGVMQKLGLDYPEVKKLNPNIVYGSVSGYGDEGPWKHKPGQDLLAQSMSGLVNLNGNADQPPMPFGLAVSDMITGAHLVQGLLAAMVKRGIRGEGSFVEVSLLESTLDFQFEVLSTYLNDGNQLPQRSSINNAHAYLGAPYGIYQSKDGFIALAMGSVVTLGQLIDCEALISYDNPDDWFDQRDTIKSILVSHLKSQTSQYWLDKLEPADYWCAEVFDWDKLSAHDGFKELAFTQTTERGSDHQFHTTRCPINIDGQRLYSAKPSPLLGEHNDAIETEFFK